MVLKRIVSGGVFLVESGFFWDRGILQCSLMEVLSEGGVATVCFDSLGGGWSLFLLWLSQDFVPFFQNHP